jgi:alcohol dehydrogenase class IV
MAFVPGNPESVFTYGAPQLKFGVGSSAEIGYDLSQYGVRRVLVVTDPGGAATGGPQRIAGQMKAYGTEAQVFVGVHVEPTDVSFRAAIEHARDSGPWDAFVAVGGGSSIGRAKAINVLRVAGLGFGTPGRTSRTRTPTRSPGRSRTSTSTATRMRSR